MMISSNTSSRFLPKFDDYIGTESCIYDLQNDNDNDNDNNVVHAGNDNYVGNKAAKRSGTKKNKEMTREFPPPIPLLARTMLKRYTTSEGRLIIKEEKVKRHEYFHAHRADGRLTLKLVPLDDDDNDENDDYLFSETSEVESASSHEQVDVGNFEDDESDTASDDNINVAIEGLSVVENNENGGASNSRFKCLNSYNSMRTSSSSCINLRVPVHPIRTVRG